MQTCPHCHNEINPGEPPHDNPLKIKKYRECPHCGGKFTVDLSTRYRQAMAALIAAMSLVFTILWYHQDAGWFIQAITSWFILGIFIYWSNKRVFFVPYQDRKKKINDT